MLVLTGLEKGCVCGKVIGALQICSSRAVDDPWFRVPVHLQPSTTGTYVHLFWQIHWGSLMPNSMSDGQSRVLIIYKDMYVILQLSDMSVCYLWKWLLTIGFFDVSLVLATSWLVFLLLLEIQQKVLMKYIFLSVCLKILSRFLYTYP